MIIGGYDENGNADPLKITFVYKTGFTDDKDGRDFKHSRRHIGGPKPEKLSQEADNEAPEKVQLNDSDAHRRENTDWVVLPVSSFDNFYCSSYFSKKVLILSN
ncbi:MAG: hypothetical protein SPL56_09555 [Lachnospiraceae bacterium]|nr:hypothetical protein [Lachnospiraceae bacterium]